jgi:glycosyltransferase involved in cell wall biosynthesis
MNIRLFVDAHVFDGEYQGTRTFIKGIYSELAKLPGLQIYLAANDIQKLRENFPAGENLTFLRYKTRSAVLRLGYEIPKLIGQYKIDFAHFQYWVPPFKNCKFIVTTHDLLFRELPDEFPRGYRIIRNYFFKRAALKADIFTTVSEHSKQSIEKYFGVAQQSIAVIANGVNDKFFDEYDKAFSQDYILKKYGLSRFILCVSRIEPRKNQALLLKAFLDLKLHESECHLVFLGKESLQVAELTKMIAALPGAVRKYLYFRSDVGDEDLLHFYRVAHLFVYPSKAEGFGIPPLEAAACRTPVVCSGTSALGDFSFFEGHQIDPYDYTAFRDKLKESFQKTYSEDHLQHLSQIIQEKYSWKKSAQTLYQLIQSNCQ